MEQIYEMILYIEKMKNFNLVPTIFIVVFLSANDLIIFTLIEQ